MLWHSPPQVKNDFGGIHTWSGLTQASSYQTTTVLAYQAFLQIPVSRLNSFPDGCLSEGRQDCFYSSVKDVAGLYLQEEAVAAQCAQVGVTHLTPKLSFRHP